MPKLPFIENFSWSWNVDFQFYKELCFRDRNKKTVTNVGLFQDLKIPPEISKFCQTYTHTLCMCVYYTHTCIEAKLSGSRRFQESQKFSKLGFFSIYFFICSYLLFPFASTFVRPPIPKVWILTITTLLLLIWISPGLFLQESGPFVQVKAYLCVNISDGTQKFLLLHSTLQWGELTLKKVFALIRKWEIRYRLWISIFETGAKSQ